MYTPPATHTHLHVIHRQPNPQGKLHHLLIKVSVIGSLE